MSLSAQNIFFINNDYFEYVRQHNQIDTEACDIEIDLCLCVKKKNNIERHFYDLQHSWNQKNLIVHAVTQNNVQLLQEWGFSSIYILWSHLFPQQNLTVMITLRIKKNCIIYSLDLSLSYSKGNSEIICQFMYIVLHNKNIGNTSYRHNVLALWYRILTTGSNHLMARNWWEWIQRLN